MGLEDFVTVVRSVRVTLRSDTALRDSLVGLLDDLAAHLERAGCKSIGHIKGYFDAPGGDPWFFSVTGFRNTSRIVGEECRGPRELSMHINVIVEGLDEAMIVAALDEVVATCFDVSEISGHTHAHGGCT